jgi:hypothetical protein
MFNIHPVLLKKRPYRSISVFPAAFAFWGSASRESWSQSKDTIFRFPKALTPREPRINTLPGAGEDS